MPNTAKNIYRYHADEYYQVTADSDELTELIDGEIIAMASPSIKHQQITGGLYSELRQFVKQNKGKCMPFISPTDVKLDDLNVVVPDVFIACNPENFDNQKYSGAPDFVAEVTSTNRSDDFDRKLWLYRSNGVREYWIIDPKNEKVLVYFFEENRFPTVYDFNTPIPIRIWNEKLSITIADLY